MIYAKHGSKTASLDDSSHEGLEKQPRVKVADLGFYAPDYVIDDIIPITDSKLIYSNVHAQRDRRLRLLIRRYTNQIQYGCRNVNCKTPTCLSYRKRNITGPLRLYTELSARTLACQLVDEYNRSGKDSVSGLCQNEPVVPWYEDPTLVKKRRNSHEKPAHQRQENGHLPKLTGLPQRTRDTSKHLPATDCGPRRTSQDGVVQAGRRLQEMDDCTIAEGSAEILNKTIPQSSLDRERQSQKHANPDLPPSSTAPEKHKDLASFTQTLFDLMPLRLLNWLPSRSGSPTGDSSESADNVGHQIQPTTDLVQEESPRFTKDADGVSGQESGERQCDVSRVNRRRTYSLATLTWYSMAWLLSPDRREDPGYHPRFIPFIKQSFAYCLSDPERLVRTVKDIQDSHSPAFRDASEQEVQAKSDENNGSLAEDSSNPWPMIGTKKVDDMKGLMVGLSFLDSFGERELIMTSILSAVQHSYSLPPRLRNRRPGKHSRSGSTSSDRVSLKRRQSSDDTNFSAARFSNATAHDILPENDQSLIQLKDSQITELCLVALLFLAVTVFEQRKASRWTRKERFLYFADVRNRGLAHSSWHVHEGRHLDLVRDLIEAIDISEEWSVRRLLLALMDVISHRLTVSKWAKTFKSSERTDGTKKTIVESLVARFDREFRFGWDATDKRSSWVGRAAIELARTVMLKDWDRSPIIQRAGPVGGALELLAGIYRERQELNLDSDRFQMPFIAEIFDDMSMPTEWLAFRADNRQMHLLSFSFLFQPHVLVKYFRAINIAVMKKSHEDAIIVYSDTKQYIFTEAIPVHGAGEVVAHLRPHMARYFVLTIRRDDILNDAINQIWRRQRRELMRPLRVRIGKDEGEDGVDHGGVQQEFFRLVFAEAFRPDYGMFTVDNTTRMAWFQPGSFEPLYRFEALGILMSLAIYNGITVPITMPLAFYRKLLGLKVKKLDHITDGWPDLAKGLKTMLEWSDGDVGDVIARTYEFSYELCGSTITVDMQKIGRDDPWPPTKTKTSKKGKEKSKSTSFELPLESTLTPPSQPSPNLSPTIPTAPILSRTSSIEIKGISTPQSIDSDMLDHPSLIEEAALVTNANRAQYVKDYILWLTHKSISLQYEAFTRGFYTCLDRTALSIFTPEALKALIEGYPEVDIDELERAATYDEYTADHSTIVDFWHVVRNMSPQQHKQLLEFVTASDRVPVNGMGSVTFIIQKNGDEDTRLPSSSTCYGRLLLPQYSSRAVLEEKLCKAIENCVGFGTL